MKINKQIDADVVIVGSGMAGSIAAYLLGKQGLNVILLDRQASCPPVFRAEKLESDQTELLRKFGLLEERRPYGKSVGEIVNFNNGVAGKIDTGEQYGIRYHETVNQIRSTAAKYVDFQVARVKDVVVDNDCPKVVLQDNKKISAKLVILACGYRSSLLHKLGIELKHMDNLYSFSFGFDLEPAGGGAFPFRGYNYHLDVSKTGVDYLTLFLIKDVMRANLFTQFSSNDSRVKNLSNDPYRTLLSLFPKLEECIGKFNVISKVESFITQYYQVESPDKPGVVLIGDAFQSVSPTTGTGLSKVLTDVDILCNHSIPEWISSDFENVYNAENFYRHPQKINTDKHSYSIWSWYHGKISAYTGLMGYLRKLKRRIIKDSSAH